MAHAVGAALVLLLAAIAFAAVGAVIVQRRPGNRVGWMMVVAGATMPLGIAVDVYAFAAHLATGEPPTSAVWASSSSLPLVAVTLSVVA